MNKREVVITGTGLTSPLGRTVSENWTNMKALKTGIGHYPKNGIPVFEYMGKIAEISIPKDIPQKILGQMKFLNRGAILGFLSAYEAINQTHYNPADIPLDRRSLYVASGDFTKVGYDFLYPS